MVYEISHYVCEVVLEKDDWDGVRRNQIEEVSQEIAIKRRYN